MLFIFLNKCKQIVTDLLFLFVGKDDSRLVTLQSISTSSWKNIASPTRTTDSYFYIFNYDNKLVKDALYYIKNKKEQMLLETFGLILSDYLLEELGERYLLDEIESPVLIEIPTEKDRQGKRGYNPSKLIAEELSRQSGIAYVPNVLQKIIRTEPQKSLQRNKRLTNMRGSMSVSKNIGDRIKNNFIIVVDDITTTGATLEEAKRALKKHGVKKMLCVALAH